MVGVTLLLNNEVIVKPLIAEDRPKMKIENITHLPYQELIEPAKPAWEHTPCLCN